MQTRIVFEDPNASRILANAWAAAEKLCPDPAVKKIIDDYTEDLIAQIRLRHQTNPYGARILYNSCICASFAEKNQKYSFCDLTVGSRKFDDRCGFLSGKDFEEITAIAHYIHTAVGMRTDLLIDLFYKQYTPEFTSSSHVNNIYYLEDNRISTLEIEKKYIHIVYRFDYFSVDL